MSAAPCPAPAMAAPATPARAGGARGARSRAAAIALAAAATLALLGGGSAHALELQGHRGARGLAPENTLPAFRHAIAVGVHTLELDVGVSRDGVVLVSHNPALEPDIVRGPDGQFLPARGPTLVSLTFAELQRYDVGRIRPDSRYASLYPQQLPVDGTRMPRLAEVLALARDQGPPGLMVSVETKLNPLAPADTLPPEAFARAVLAELRASGLPPQRLSVQSFDWRTLQVIQREAPAIATVYLSSESANLNTVAPQADGRPSPWHAGFSLAEHGSVPRLVRAAGGRIWSSAYAALTPERVKEAQALGLRVLAWTVNDPAQISRLIDMGVDGLISDHPERVRAEMQRRGLPLPEARPGLALPGATGAAATPGR